MRGREGPPALTPMSLGATRYLAADLGTESSVSIMYKVRMDTPLILPINPKLTSTGIEARPWGDSYCTSIIEQKS
jgi:hypothetical protein